MDSLVVFFYLVLSFFVGIYASRKVNTFEQFCIAERNYSTPTVVATLFATVIGGGSTIGIYEKSFEHGLIFILAFYGFVFNRLLAAIYIIPKIKEKGKKLSVGDIMCEFYGKNGRKITGIFAVLVSLASVGTQCQAIGYVLQAFLEIPLEIGVLVGCSIFVFYAAFGGMKAVVWTDVLQFGIIVSIFPLLLFFPLQQIGT
ncbi:MAG: sodium:solute symporter family transporter, partial [Alphaproteobacteria bacterium]